MTPLPSSSRGRNRRAPMADINVTPMVDVMLVLLIIFMVTAPLLMAGVPVNLPDSNAMPLTTQEKEPIQISVQRAIVIGSGFILRGSALLVACGLDDILHFPTITKHHALSIDWDHNLGLRYRRSILHREHYPGLLSLSSRAARRRF